MKRVNLARVSVSADPDDPKGFRSSMARFGTDFGAAQTGSSLYEIPPGEALCPYHYEHAEEEWLLVLDGHPTVRDPDGEHRLDPLDLVFFPRGPDGAHRVQNDSDEPVRVLMYSDLRYPAVTVYPDSDKVGVWTEGRVDNVMVRRSSGVDYFDGEV